MKANLYMRNERWKDIMIYKIKIRKTKKKIFFLLILDTSVAHFV